jgi:hypothetical protein
MNKRMRGEGADHAPVGWFEASERFGGTSGRSGIVVISSRGAGMLHINRFRD